MTTINPSDFLKLQNKVAQIEKKFDEFISWFPNKVDIKSLAIELQTTPQALSRYIKRHSSELGVGTIFKDDEFEVIDGKLFVYKSAVLKLKEIYG